jgi:VanZ family protein
LSESEKSNKWRGRIFRYAPLILWIGVVLFASTTTASMSNTSRFIRPLLEFLFPNTPEETLLIYHGYIRKIAHLTEYGVLAFWASRAFWNSSVRFLQNYWFFAAFVLAVLIALIDEFNQSFNTTRTGSIYDVLIDASGATIVIIILFAYKFFQQKQK